MKKLLLAATAFSALVVCAQANDVGVRLLSGEDRIATLPSVDVRGAEITGAYDLMKVDQIGDAYVNIEGRFLKGSEHGYDIRDNRFSVDLGIKRNVVENGTLLVVPFALMYESTELDSAFNVFNQKRWFYAPSISYKHTLGDFAIKADAAYRYSINEEVTYATVSHDVYGNSMSKGYDIGIEASYMINKEMSANINWTRESLKVPGDGAFTEFTMASHFLGAGLNYKF